MDIQVLLLRQRRLLDSLQHTTGYVTGVELAQKLGVSSRTIRNDVREINRVLAGTGIRIVSKHSFGYLLQAENIETLKQLTQVRGSFISRSERLRYIAQRLCLADQPIDIDDLADEMYISHATMEHDLKSLRQEYILQAPYIYMQRHRNSVEFEHDERKRRKMLSHLYSKDWNYNGSGNTFFRYEFLDKDVVETCMHEVSAILGNHHMLLDDTNVVHLDLITAVAYERIRSGYHLTRRTDEMYIIPEAVPVADELLDDLSEKLDIEFDEAEHEDIYELISCSLYKNALARDTVAQKVCGDLVHHYLKILCEVYHIDLSHDAVLEEQLVDYIYYLTLPVHNLNDSEFSPSMFTTEYAVEMELAMRFQPLALKFYGNYLDFNELCYLVIIISGGMARKPLNRLNTVVMSHLNQAAAWNLEAQLESMFREFLNITELLPIYEKNIHSFDGVDLIISTADKRITDIPGIDTIRVSPFFTQEDRDRISHYLRQIRMRQYGVNNYPDTITLLDQAAWHEMLDCPDYLSFLEYLGDQMISQGIVSEAYLQEVFRRERLLSFATHESFLLVHTSVPAKKTHIEVGTLNHRVNVDSNKIRTIIMVAMAPGDEDLIFKLLYDLYSSNINPHDTRFFKTKTEFLNYLRKR